MAAKRYGASRIFSGNSTSVEDGMDVEYLLLGLDLEKLHVLDHTASQQSV